jgi:hypothetical protein
MPGSEQSTPPPWNESDSVRETTLQLLDDPEDREAVCRAGQVLYDLAVVVTCAVGGIPGDPSITRAELRAVDTNQEGGILTSRWGGKFGVQLTSAGGESHRVAGVEPAQGCRVADPALDVQDRLDNHRVGQA